MESPTNPPSFSRAYGLLAETIVSDRGFRHADADFYNSKSLDLVEMADIEAHKQARNAAKELIFDSYVEYGRRPAAEQKWQLARETAIVHMGGVALGPFYDYLTSFEGEVTSSELSIDNLPEGDGRVITTNSKIIMANKTFQDPVEFIDAALEIIQRRKRQLLANIGPENYATAIKFFTDKYAALEHPTREVDPRTIKDYMDECVGGFINIWRNDEPNFIEMTNVYASIRMLPQGSVDHSFTGPLINQSLRSLPDYSNDTISTMLSALPKLDLTGQEEPTAQLVNLAIRKSKKFEKTADMRITLRAISVLPRSQASEQALKAFFEYRNDLEQSLDIIGAEEVVDRLRVIADIHQDNLPIVAAIKEIAERAARSISEKAKRALLEGRLSTEQEVDLREAFERIMRSYLAI